jgi:hypothetical protein
MSSTKEVWTRFEEVASDIPKINFGPDFTALELMTKFRGLDNWY